MNYFFKRLVIIGVLLSLSCESDDICLEEITPRLIINFYDKDLLEKTKVESLTVWIKEKDSLFVEEELDSIQIQLNPGIDTTRYVFANGTKQEQLLFTYSRNHNFISESCGFKTIFEDLTIDYTNEWIHNIIINESTIENEVTTHLSVYF